MFNNHKMSVVTDLNVLGQAINDINYVSIAAVTTNDYPRYSNIYNAAILLPPTQILMQWADGNPVVIQNQYPAYLANNKEADGFIVALLAALTKKNVVLYIPKDDFNVFGPVLLQHLYYMYGITVEVLIAGLQQTQFSIIPDKIPFILSKLYMNDLLDANVLLDAYPPQYALPDFVINKLAFELRPLDNTATFQDYANYFNGVVAKRIGNKINMVEVL